MRLLLSLFLVFFCFNSFAVKTNVPDKKLMPAYKAPKGFKQKAPKLYMSKNKTKKILKKDVPKLKRKVAAVESVGESDMSEEVRGIIQKILAAKTPDALAKLLTEADSKYESYKNNDTKFLVAQLAPALVFRGWFYKVKPLLSKAKVSHSALVTAARQVAGVGMVYLPQDHWQAGFDFLAQPDVSSETGRSRFYTEQDLSDYNLVEIIPALMTARRRMEALDFSSKDVVWDNKLIFNDDTFGDARDRFRLMGEAERYAALAIVNTNLYALSMQNAYSIDGLLSIFEGIGKSIGFDKLTALGTIDGASAKTRRNIISKHKSFLKLRSRDSLKSAWVYLQDAIRTSQISWEITKESPAQTFKLLDPAIFNPFERINNLSFATMAAMLEGRTTITSSVTGEIVSVDLPSMFSNPPKDLKVFLPTQFDSGPEDLSVKSEKGQITYRNYRRGRAIGWNVNAFKPYFPGIEKRKNDAIPAASRILAQTWGGWLMGTGLVLVH